MTPQQLFQAGQLDEAIQALSAEVRDNPQDVKRRTFLFELLCFSGDLSRAEKHLDLAAQGSQQAEMGALLYHAALHAERTRRDLFTTQQYPMPKKTAGLGALSVSINGKLYHSIHDGDPRIASNLEVFAAGSYMWIPFSMITSIEISAPKRLRDLLWLPAKVRTSDKFEERELGEILLPVLPRSLRGILIRPSASAAQLFGKRRRRAKPFRPVKRSCLPTMRSGRSWSCAAYRLPSPRR